MVIKGRQVKLKEDSYGMTGELIFKNTSIPIPPLPPLANATPIAYI